MYLVRWQQVRHASVRAERARLEREEAARRGDHPTNRPAHLAPPESRLVHSRAEADRLAADVRLYVYDPSDVAVTVEEIPSNGRGPRPAQLPLFSHLPLQVAPDSIRRPRKR